LRGGGISTTEMGPAGRPADHCWAHHLGTVQHHSHKTAV